MSIWICTIAKQFILALLGQRGCCCKLSWQSYSLPYQTPGEVNLEKILERWGLVLNILLSLNLLLCYFFRQDTDYICSLKLSSAAIANIKPKNNVGLKILHILLKPNFGHTLFHIQIEQSQWQRDFRNLYNIFGIHSTQSIANTDSYKICPYAIQLKMFSLCDATQLQSALTQL